MQHNQQLWRCSCSALFETSSGLDYHLEFFEDRGRVANAELQSSRDHFAVTTLPDQTSTSEVELQPGGISCPKCDQTFNERRDLRRHFQLYVYCFEQCAYCHRPFTLAKDFLAHHHKDPRATATYAAAIAMKGEDEDGEDEEDDDRDYRSRKAYMAERREIVLKKVERKLRRSEARRKRPPTGDPAVAIQQKRPRLMNDLLEQGDPPQTGNFDRAPQAETGATDSVLRFDVSPSSRKESSNHAQSSMADSGYDDANALPRMPTIKSSAGSAGNRESARIDQYSSASIKEFDTTGEEAGVYMASSSAGVQMAVINHQLLADSTFDVTHTSLVEAMLQEVPGIHTRLNYPWQ